MTIKSIKKFHNMGNGGIHWHEIMDPNDGTMEDGIHAHFFVVNGIPITTEWDGEHSHDLDIDNNKTLPENQKHTHMVKIADDLL